MVEGMAGHGRQVTDIQAMPKAAPRNVDQSLAAILGAGGAP
jgi:dihydroorotase